MFEYKVVTSSVKKAETIMNIMANDGWRVVNVSPNVAMMFGVIITFEREKLN